MRRNERIDLGLAIDSPDGLFVPVLRDVRSAPSTPPGAGRSTRFKDGVKDRTLAPADFRAPTITLSNFGTIAGPHAALIVMPPQVAIVGAGRITGSSGSRQGTLALHRVLPLSLTFDHRAVTGGEAARFLRAVIADLEQRKLRTVMEDPFGFADEFGPSRIIHIHYRAVGLKAIVVVDNTACGPRSAACAWRRMCRWRSASDSPAR